MNTIHLGNYEEFFILYMDNELSKEQVKMVDEFLIANPDLKVEFEILMSTKLPLEDLSFDKKDLLADSMRQTLVDEELLLYIDNELPSDKKKTVELEIASNKNYQLQHQLLLQTKLDPSEKIEYPNKKELYRKTERVVAFKVWMRIAAAAVIIAVSGIVYFKNSSPSTITPDHPQNTAGIKRIPVQRNAEKKNEQVANPVNSSSDKNNNQVAVVKPSKKEVNSNQTNQSENRKEIKEDYPVQPDVIAYDRPVVKTIETNTTTSGGIAEPNIPVNKVDVTSSLANRINNSSGDDENDNNNKLLASNDRKGSVKGFLRKATRMIEKRTGIDPTNGNGELLIGAVALNLK